MKFLILFAFTAPGCIQRITSRDLEREVVNDTMIQNQQLLARAECAGPLSNEPEIQLLLQTTMQKLKVQRIDATTTKNGFKEGQYLTLFPIDSNKTFIKLERNRLPRGMDSLRIKRIDTDQKITADKRNEQGIIPDGKEPSFLIRVDRFEPGLNYFFRLLSYDGKRWIPVSTVRVQAPVCPFDQTEGK